MALVVYNSLGMFMLDIFTQDQNIKYVTVLQKNTFVMRIRLKALIGVSSFWKILE